MKKMILAIFLLSPAMVNAQEMNPEMMKGMNQEMMQALQEMATCMASVDQKEVKAMETKAKALEADIKKMCKSGKRDEAQKKAMDFSKTAMQSETFITARKCTENLPAAMKGMVPDMSAEKIAEEFKNKHVCDEI